MDKIKAIENEQLRANPLTLNIGDTVRVHCKIKEGNKEESEKELNVTLKNIDKALNAGLIKKNNAARKKSRLTKSVNAIK